MRNLPQWINGAFVPIIFFGLPISVYALLSLVATLTNIAFVLFVLLKNPRSALNRIWALVVLCLVIWGSGEFVMRVTEDWNTADLARRISGIGYCLIASPFLHFCLTFTNRRKFLDQRWSLLILYSPGVLASILLLSGWITKTAHLPWGFTPSPSVAYLPYSLWLEAFFLYGLFLTYLKSRRAITRRERYQSLFILLGVSIPLLLGSITGVILPLLGIEAFRIAVTATTITAGLVTFAIVKFQLMSLTPQTTAAAILNTMTDFLAVTDLDGNVIFMNESFRTHTSDHEKTNRPLHIKDFLNDHERILKITKGLSTLVEKSQLLETRFSVSNGRSFPVLLSMSPILDSGDLIGFVLLAHDITERNRAQEELRRSETRFRSVWKNSADAMRLTDEQGTIVAVNDSFCRFVEMPFDEVVGEPVTVTYRGKKDMSRMLENYRKRFAERSVETRLEQRLTLPSGRTLYIQGTNSFIELEGGKALLLGIFRDITDRKKAEQKIQMLAHTITSMNECVVITDMQNTIISVNPAFLKTYGYDEEEVLLKSAEVLSSRANPEGFLEKIFSQTLKGGWQGELLDIRKKGEIFPVLLSTSVICNEANTPVALVRISRDITEQKLLQQQLEETARQRTEDLQRFASSVQQAQEEERQRIARELHDDICQRLSAMKLSLGSFEEFLPKRDRSFLRNLRSIRREIDAMITDVRRISTNLRPTALDDFGLMIALQQLCKNFEMVRNIKVCYEANGSIPSACDRDVQIALYRITQEALSNVSNHSRASRVWVSLSHDETSVRLSVVDNGKGFRLQEVMRRKDPGRRLGLINMKERSELLGGTFQLDSSPRNGTRIFVGLPIHSSNAHEKEENQNRSR